MAIASQVPQPIIIGIFLYLGVSSIRGNQMFDRLYLLFVWDKSRWPAVDYATGVPTGTVVKFTVLQVVCMVALFVVSYIPGVSVIFPFLIGLLVPFRKVIVKRLFSPESLAILDK